ncbi:type VII secretion protein EccE [Nocardia sp. NPDC051570]|uniref:type VII secretion protein EccE n=1 Tax=Nocardia sp. NPDC051570 TaxID=3364324 RepID=UPI0037A590B6
MDLELCAMGDVTMSERVIPGAAEIPPLRSGPRGLFGWLPLSVVLPSAAAAAVAGTVTIAFRGSLWVALGVGLGIAAVGGIRLQKTNIWRILAMRSALGWRNWRGTGIRPYDEPFEVPVPESGGARCGMRWDGRHLITMLRVDRTDVTPTLLRSTEIRSDAAVSLAEVARCVSQFDIRLAAVDVVTFGVRTRGPREVVRLYEQLLGPLPAAAARTVWLVLRFDPLDNAEAIDNRGGGQDGMIRTALVATRRVAGRLATRGIRISMLTAAELAAAEAATLHDTDPRDWAEGWRALRGNDIRLAGYTVRPERLDPDALAAVWALPGVATLTRLRMTPAIGSNTPTRQTDTVALTALVRHDTDDEEPECDRTPAGLGLRPLSGSQRRILMDGGHPGPSAAAHGVPAAMARFLVPTGGCGQVIGATSDGFGVAVPLFGPAVRRVEIVGGLRLVQLMILRAIAVGARVIVHSTRPQVWDRLVREVDEPEALSVSSQGGAQHTAAATMIVYDGVASTGQVSEATAVHFGSMAQTSAAILAADVVLIESPDDPGEVLIRTAGGEVTVQLVWIPEESRYLGVADPA